MADIPIRFLEQLSKLVLTAYEWRVLMVIIARLMGRKRDAIEISLDEFFSTTGIRKSHLCRSLNSLEDRNVINRVTYKNTTFYSLQLDSERWRSFLSAKIPKKTMDEWEARFEKWFERYPFEIYKEDAKAMYLQILSKGEATADQLDDALAGYIKMKIKICQKMGRDPDPMTCMYPTSFLKDGKWEEFVKFKDMEMKRW